MNVDDIIQTSETACRINLSNVIYANLNGGNNMAFEFTDANFQKEALESDIPVLVDFFADWCGPCKMVAPIVAELADQYAGVFKIGKLNVDEQPETAGKYRVMSIPTLLIIKGGSVVDTIVGSVPKKTIEDKLLSYK